jgi:uncharacterized protein (DUF488 family)
VEELIDLLKRNDVRLLVDVRSAPGSRRMPHFARAALSASMPRAGIAYMHMPELGGHRRPRRDSVNGGWRNDGFRGYADYMQQPEFWAALDQLRVLARERRTAIMCAEAVPWRCHRSLISDALTIAGVDVRHITGSGAPSQHHVTPFARVEGGSITYPPTDRLPLGEE